MEKFGVVIAAAGSGTRFGSDKMTQELCGVPVLLRTVRAFEAADSVGGIVIVTRADGLEYVRNITADCGKVIAVTVGGETRSESVKNGVSLLPSDYRYVSVHDGARPLITPARIDCVHAQAVRFGAACAVLPVVDTVHCTDRDGFVVSSPERASLVAAATPQAFERALYERALAQADGREFTDEVGLLRAASVAVKTVVCNPENRKITTRSDLWNAERILREEE